MSTPISSPMVPLDWMVPPKYQRDGTPTPEDRIRGWAREATQQGETYIKAQRGFADMDRAIDIIAGISNRDGKRPRALSKVRFGKIKRAMREVIATEASLRALGNYRSDNPDLHKNAEVLNKLTNAWWFNTFADRKLREAFQWCGIGGSGWVSPVWSKDFYTFGRGDIDLRVYNSRDVKPIQIGRDHDIQRAYAVTITAETPIAQAAAEYPLFIDFLVPTRSRASWLRKGLQVMERYLSPALNVGGPRGKEREPSAFPTIDLNYTYILDLSINDTGHSMPMGKPGTSWHYTVPAYGSDIATSVIDPRTGQNLIRKATEEDALLYPLRRLIVWTDNIVLYDDTSPWWHAKYPLVKFSFDDWVFDFLGFSMVRDVAELGEAVNDGLRAIQDSANVRLRPPLQYDRNAITKSFMETFDPRQPQQSVGVDLNMGEPIKPILPPQFYDVPPWMTNHIRDMEQRIDYTLGVPDLAALVRAKQIPASDSADRMLEIAGPVVQDIGTGIERSMRDLGELMKGMFFQFYSTNRKIQILGPDGTTEEDYDFDPGNLVPSHLPGEDPDLPSKVTMIERAKFHMNNFYFHIVRGTAHQITQMSRKLLYTQLYIRGFPIDPWTLADALDLSNFGPPPKGTTTVMEKWVAWMHMKAELTEELAAAMPQPGPGGGARGRPPSGLKPPRMAQKDGGMRTTITES